MAMQVAEGAVQAASNNITMIKILANYAAEAVADRGANTARIRLGEIVTYAQETIAMLNPAQQGE